ncbi:MAG: methyltransferase domain-containing protein [Nitrospirae bacterium]|nr:methyltransferase domain-containing protein [Nitrospirota bacterium]
MMTDDFKFITRLSDGFAASRILQAAVAVGLFDVIGEGGLTAGEIARLSKTGLRAVEIVLNALAALGLLEKKEAVFYLSPPSKKYLVSGSPYSLAGMIRFDGRLWGIWEKLEETIRTGKPSRPTEMFQADAGETDLFIEAMDSLVHARGDAEYLAKTLRFDDVGSFLDIGSGPATYPIAICRTHPDLKVTVFDLPGTLQVTRRYVEKAGMTDRIRLVPGDYNRDPLPEGFDRVFLSNVIHGEDEARNRRLMKKVHQALRPGGRVLIKDHVMDESMTSPAAGAVFSVQMLLTNAGRDYAFSEVKGWLEEAGFTQITETLLPPPMTSSLVTGIKG